MVYECVFCYENNDDYGNNPSPITNKGRCCDKCNKRYVLVIRMCELSFLSKLNENQLKINKDMRKKSKK